MITTEQIIEVAKECGFPHKVNGVIPLWNTELTKFANHFYKRGLLDAADACAGMDGGECIFSRGLRDMAEEVKP
jgi:hypothetical protein